MVKVLAVVSVGVTVAVVVQATEALTDSLKVRTNR